MNRAQELQVQRTVERGLAEMVGLIHGVIADGHVSEAEAQRLAEWTRAHPEVATRYPANLLARRLERIFMDGKVDARETERLVSMLAQLAENPSGLGGGAPLATDLPTTVPAPDIVFGGQTFVFGGAMAYGPLHACEREVIERGGMCEQAVNRRTDYVVIGALAAADWAQSAFGGLINEVVAYRSRGVPIAVISEEHWTGALT